MLSSALQVLLSGVALGPLLRARRRFAVPKLTLGVLSILILCALAQAGYPGLLQITERSPMVLQGQAWRLLTAPWFQDGGSSGAALNLSMLVAIGWAGETELERPCWMGAYACGGLAGGLAGLAWQPVGAGNSIAVRGVAGPCLRPEGCARNRCARGDLEQRPCWWAC